MELAKNDSKLEGMGTTLVAAVDVGEELLIASVGDSRAYLFDGNSFRAVTQDQSWVNEVGRPLGLDEATLRSHPMRNVLTMAIGASPNLVVNCYSIPWRSGSLALLSSDGLHGVVRDDLMESIVRDGEGLEAMSQRFIDAARAAGGPDNVTAVLLRRTE
jgi:serine/threonine protein phosphatase PrpC